MRFRIAPIRLHGIAVYFSSISSGIRRFTDNDEIHFNRTNRFIILFESFKIHATRKLLDFGNRIQNIMNTVSPVSR